MVSGDLYFDFSTMAPADLLFAARGVLLARGYASTAGAQMPRRNTVKLKRPSKQLLRRRRNRLKRRRDKSSARRHAPRPDTLAVKRDALTPLTLGEARVQHAVATQDPAYIAAAQQLYDNITSIPMEALLEGSGAGDPFAQLAGGRPVKIGRAELLEMDPEMEALRVIDPEAYAAQVSTVDLESLAEEAELGRMIENLSYFDEGRKNAEDEEEGKGAVGSVEAGALLGDKSDKHDADPSAGLGDSNELSPRERKALKEHHRLEKNLIAYEARMQQVASMTESAVGIADVISSNDAALSIGALKLRDYNHALRVCGAHGRVDLALDIFARLKTASLVTSTNVGDEDNAAHMRPRPPNEASFVALGAACAAAGDAETCWDVILQWRKYFGMGESIELSTAYITALSNSGNLDHAEATFEAVLDSARDPLTNMVRRNTEGMGGLYTVDAPLCNAMLSAFSRHGAYDRAWELFHRMRQDLCDADGSEFRNFCVVLFRFGLV